MQVRRLRYVRAAGATPRARNSGQAQRGRVDWLALEDVPLGEGPPSFSSSTHYDAAPAAPSRGGFVFCGAIFLDSDSNFANLARHSAGLVLCCDEICAHRMGSPCPITS